MRHSKKLVVIFASIAVLIQFVAMNVESPHPKDKLTIDDVSSAKVANQAESKDGSPNGKVIAYVKSRDHLLAIYSTVEGPRFDVSTVRGQLLIANVSLSELRDRHPELYRTYSSGFADSWAGSSQNASQPVGIPTSVLMIEAR